VALLYIPLTVIAILVLMTRAYETVRSVGDDELMDRALALARSLPPPSSGSAEFDFFLGSPRFQQAAHAHIMASTNAQRQALFTERLRLG
jgi:hypothetical protein